VEGLKHGEAGLSLTGVRSHAKGAVGREGGEVSVSELRSRSGSGWVEAAEELKLDIGVVGGFIGEILHSKG
jgi:hypothetical protein